MFYKYEIKNNGREDILYLHLTMQYEFSDELTLEDKVVDFNAQNFIKTNNIKFRGNKICLVVDGKIIKCMYINNKILNNNYISDSFMVNISLDDKALCEISLREYLLSILFSYYSSTIHIETFKAMTILFTGFAFKMMNDNNCILSNNRFFKYYSLECYKNELNNYEEIKTIFNNIINEVDGMYLFYENDYILPFIHYSNSGKTKNNKNYPYLSSVKSLWDLASPYFINIKDYSFDEINKKLNISISSSSEINIIKDNYKKIKIGSIIFSMQEFKNTLDLKSDDIYIIINNDNLRIISKGFGNSYGLSIFGASEIAKNDCKYYHILKYYFPKAKLLKKVKELSK